jgi:hypothetical protein
MTDNERAKLIEDLHAQLRSAASTLQQLDAEVSRLRDHHQHGEAEALEKLVAPWRSALLSDQINASRLERWRAEAAAAGHRL